MVRGEKPRVTTLQSLWLIPLAPAAAALLNLSLSGRGRLARAWSPRLARSVTVAALVASAALSVGPMVALRQLPSNAAERVDVLGDWIPKLPVATRDAMSILDVPWGLRLDRKSTTLLLAVLVWGALASIYTSVLMTREPRTLAVRMSAFLGSSVCFLVLVALGSSLPVVFAGWAGAVATSALIGRPPDTGVDRSAESSIALPFGLAAFMLAIGLTFAAFGTLDTRAVERAAAALPPEAGPWGLTSSTSLLIAIAVVTPSGACVFRSGRLVAWLPIAAGLCVLWQVSALTSRATLAAGAGLAIGALAACLAHHRRMVV